ncbi:MAG TPA: hypothetical protein VK667_05095, partial [Ktedonobacteraceae bacterium]|nr:hypothetical protein [Ktedonobacteraceae bacterium]
MKHQKLVLLTLLLLGVLGAASLGPNHLLPSVAPAHAIACPFGGPGTPSCLTVSLDPVSKPTKTAVTGCTIPVGQYGLCDTVITVIPLTQSNVTTFRVGAILNATTATPALNVFAWQFQINYDPTIVTPQGDPSILCTGYPDCGEKTVWFGSQSGTGNWAGSIGIGAGNPGGGTGAISICENGGAGSKCPDPRTGNILVGFTFVNPAISPAITLTART